MTIYDPYYTQPLVRRRGSARDDNVDISEQASCDPDSYYRDLVEAGRLEQHLNALVASASVAARTRMARPLSFGTRK